MADQFTLAELAERLGMQARTIRSYIEQGLLRGPEIGGRGARYTEYHARRLQAIWTLKELRGLPLSEVRQQLLLIAEPELASLAKEGEVTRTSASRLNTHSALGYLRSINPGIRAESEVASTPDVLTPIDILVGRLDRLAEGTQPPRRARGEVWTSIPVTPDIEIRVRGTKSAHELTRWERIADHLRHILMGGSKEEQ